MPLVDGNWTVDLFDYSAARPSNAALGSIVAVARYTNLAQNAWKSITRKELDWHHANNRGVYLNSEGSGREPFGGPDAAKWSWEEDRNDLQNLGAPNNHTLIITRSMDTQVSPNDKPTVLDYYRAYRDLSENDGYLGRAYGQFDLMESLADIGITRNWGCSAWGGKASYRGSALYQFSNSHKLNDGSDVDFNTLLSTWEDTGIWWPENSPYNHGGNTLSDAQVAAINAHTDKAVAGIFNIPVAWGQPGKTQPAWALIRAILLAAYANGKTIDALSAAVKTLLANDVSETQRLDALTALENAQTASTNAQIHDVLASLAELKAP